MVNLLDNLDYFSLLPRIHRLNVLWKKEASEAIPKFFTVKL